MTKLTELGQVLHEEHFRILVSICGLENRVSGEMRDRPLDPTDGEDLRQLDELLASLDGVIEHHVFEETVVFPLISDGGDADLALLLMREHGAIEPMARRLRNVTLEMVDGHVGNGRWDEFCAAAHALVQEVMAHLQREELGIVQRLDTLLDPETDRRLARRLSHRRLGLDALAAERPADADRGGPIGRPRRSTAADAAARAARRRVTGGFAPRHA